MGGIGDMIIQSELTAIESLYTAARNNRRDTTLVVTLEGAAQVLAFTAGRTATAGFRDPDIYPAEVAALSDLCEKLSIEWKLYKRGAGEEWKETELPPLPLAQIVGLAIQADRHDAAFFWRPFTRGALYTTPLSTKVAVWPTLFCEEFSKK